MTDSYRPYTPDTWPEPRSAIVFPEELNAAQLKRRKFTAEEFYRMVPACILGEDTLEELIDGDVVVRAYQSRRHSSAVSELMRLFILSPMPSLYPSAHCPIRFDDYNEPVADIVLLAKEFESAEHPGPNDLTLAVEIADTDEEVEYDRNAKLPLYARFGLQEVWLVRLQSSTVEVHRNAVGGSYREVTQLGRGDTLTIQERPEVRIGVDELLT